MNHWPWSKITALFIAILLVVSMFNIRPWRFTGRAGSILSWDVTSYYGYLPAYFIHDDLSLEFIREQETWYHSHMMFWPKKTPDNRYVFKMTMGVSMLYAPFFLVADQIEQWNDGPRTGFSQNYERALALSSLFYLLIGLFFLRKLLRANFSEEVSSYVLILLFTGSNLYYYGTTEPCLSHAYSFSLITLLAYFSMKWHDSPRMRYALIVGLCGGIVTLIRPSNAIYFLIPVFYGFSTIKVLGQLIQIHWKHILIMLIAAFFMVLPQLCYWKFATGDWIYYSYGEERLFLESPHILKSLFAYRNGWLLYSPLMVFALIGVFFLRRQAQKWSLGLTVFFILNIYLISSWWCWWYGGAFGGRAYVDSYPLLAIALAALLTTILSGRRAKIARPILIVVGLAIIALNGIQTDQARKDVFHWSGMTKEAYWAQFLKLKKVEGLEEMWKLPDDEKALLGEEEYEFDPF